ncbi:MAG: thioredoxin family protein [Planctomycetales bacterium]|nr:thioredoxin family protein [Planctomycetales bacterium]
MVRTASTMLPLGTVAPDFSLTDLDGQVVTRDSLRGREGTLVIFMCNHCPYVKHVAPAIAALADEFQEQGIQFVGVNSNDVNSHPDDAPEMMKLEAQAQGYHFPYLFDETQKVAQDYHAACTPDFFLFDKELKLVYRGQLDSTRPRQGVNATGEDLRAALEALLNQSAVCEQQHPSVGCNIKWKAGNEPDYFNPAGVS